MEQSDSAQRKCPLCGDVENFNGEWCDECGAFAGGTIVFRPARESLRRRWGRFLERHDRCCHCTRKLNGKGGTHAFGFWFCHRHFNAKTIGPWSDA